MPLRRLLESIDDPALLVGNDGVVVDANDVMTQAGGEVVGRRLGSVVPVVDDDDAMDGGIENWLGTTVDGRHATLRHGEGEPAAVTVTVVPLADDTGTSLVVASLAAQRRGADRPDRALRRLGEAEQLAGLGSWEWDVATHEVYWSDQFCRLLGLDPAEVEPSYDAYMARVHPEDLDRLLADLNAVFDSDQPFTTEHRVVCPDGVVREVRARAAVVRDEHGAPLRLLGSALDITEQREVQRKKDEFVSVVSHELRTPLTSISGALGLLVGGAVGELPPQAQRMIDIATTNADRLVRLINDILDLERIESGRVELAREDLEVERVVADAVTAMEPVAHEAGVRLASDVEPASRVVGDADRLQQVLTNLISNAVKYSSVGGTVTVSGRREDDTVVLRVTDRGTGIPPEDARRIFERFEQVDASDARAKGGTGLGLAICQTIVDEHEGEVWAESEVGQGTTVVVRLPASPLHEAGSGHQPLVLVCDDEADARAIAQTTLETTGYRVITSRDGDEALRRAAAERPDAIVLDLVMPGRDGWQTAAALQRDPATSDIPVVIFSALSSDEWSVEARISDWVDKAMVDADLVGAVDRAIGSVAGEPPAGRLLLVEDDPDLAGVLAEAFRRHGLAVWVAHDGPEAERMCTRIEPHALVLDLLLPERDGFAVVASMRQQEQLRRTPLVVYSALDLDAEQRAELRLGPTEHFTKGQVSPQQLEQRVVELMRGVAPRPLSGETPA